MTTAEPTVNVVPLVTAKVADAVGEQAPAPKVETFSAEDMALVRSEAAANRIKARDAEKTADDRIKAAMKALGLDDKADPAEVAKQAATERDTARAEHREVALELAIFRNAGDANPNALLDSRAFMKSISEIDPTDTPKITAAIIEAIKGNASLKSVPTQAVGASSVQHTSGSGSAPDIDVQIADATKHGDHTEAIRLKRLKARS